MTLASMTAFARAAGDAGPWRLAWELKSVNAKGLDLRLRLSPPFGVIEPEARGKIAGRLARGTVYATLITDREPTVPKVRINQDLLRELIGAVTRIALPEKIAPATLDGLLAVRGVMDVADADNDATILQARASALDLPRYGAG